MKPFFTAFLAKWSPILRPIVSIQLKQHRSFVGLLLASLALLLFTVQCTPEMHTGPGGGAPTNMQPPQPVYTDNLTVLAGRDSLTLFWDYTNTSTNEVTNVGFKIAYTPDGGTTQNVILPTTDLSNRRSHTITNLNGSAPYQVSVRAVHNGVDQEASVLENLSFNDRGSFEPTALVSGTAADGDDIVTLPYEQSVTETTGDKTFNVDLDNDGTPETITLDLFVKGDTLTDTNLDAITFTYSNHGQFIYVPLFELTGKSTMIPEGILTQQTNLNSFDFTGNGGILYFSYLNYKEISATSLLAGDLVISSGLMNLLLMEDLQVAIQINIAGMATKIIVSLDLSMSPAMNYTITAGNDGDIFAIDSSTGEITIASGKASELNPLTRSAYLLETTYTLGDGTMRSQEVLVRVR